MLSLCQQEKLDTVTTKLSNLFCERTVKLMHLTEMLMTVQLNVGHHLGLNV